MARTQRQSPAYSLGLGDKFAAFWMNTKGQIYLSADVLGKRASQEALTSLLAALRALGIDAPDKTRELTFDAGRLAQAAGLSRFRSAILEIKEAVGRVV